MQSADLNDNKLRQTFLDWNLQFETHQAEKPRAPQRLLVFCGQQQRRLARRRRGGSECGAGGQAQAARHHQTATGSVRVSVRTFGFGIC